MLLHFDTIKANVAQVCSLKKLSPFLGFPRFHSLGKPAHLTKRSCRRKALNSIIHVKIYEFNNDNYDNNVYDDDDDDINNSSEDDDINNNSGDDKSNDYNDRNK